MNTDKKTLKMFDRFIEIYVFYLISFFSLFGDLTCFGF